MSEHLKRTIPTVLADAATRWGDRLAIEDGSTRLTFAELQGAAQELARACISHGLETGQRFAIWAPNSWAWEVAAIGGQLAGGVLVPINTRYKGSEAADILRRSGSRLLFVTDEFLGQSYPAMLEGESLPDLATQVLLTDDGIRSFAGNANTVPDSVVRERATGIRSDDIADILYTSGTTGAPKGVMVTHGQNIATFMNWSDAVGLTESDRYLIVNPFFHSFGYKAGWLAALLRGATSYPAAVFDVPDVLERIQRDRISMLPGAPTIFQSLLAHPDRHGYDLSSLRCAVTGAASVPVQLVKDMKHELGFDEVYTAYGLTESTGVVSLCRSGDDFETIANTSGRAMDGVEIQITGAAGEALEAGEAGEVWVRGFNVMKGYLDNPDATADTITADGWLKTGDIGVMDARGYLRITDRVKDMYICGGFNCYPAEIEHQLLEHPAIADVAVKGAPDERMGEVGHAFVVAAPGCEPEEGEIVAWARERMANYKAPRRVTVVDALPRNASGKVQKFLLS